ncbi:MAG: efflux RND transporter permease subunit [Pseudomonadales bacterium]|nr:efflux RND transporter permease subunit [Pseudomonadales bacterium]
MNKFLESLILRPRTILMITFLLFVSGVMVYIGIVKESSPNIAMPMVIISVPFDGVSAEDAESLLIKPMEKELRDLDDIKILLSEATEGHAGITIEFVSGTDESRLLSAVREKVDKAKVNFPKGVDEPNIKQITAANQEVILTLIISGQQNYRSLVTQAEQLKTQLELLPEILEVKVIGGSDEVIDIEIDPVRIQSYQLDVASISQLIKANSALIPAGSLESEQGSLAIKIPSVFRQPNDVLSLPVVVDDVRVLTLSDIADVRFTHKKPDEKTRLNTDPSIELRIYKKSGVNILDTVGLIEAKTSALETQWPATTKVTYLHNKAEDVANMINDLQSSILSSVVLVVIVLVAALGLRSALLVGISIPISFLSGIIIISMLGYSVNMVVLFSLIMAVGMLVDGAIVVIELAQRKLQQGLDSGEAYIRAAQQMAWPIIASTATTLSAFIPLLFWPGFFGQYMKFLPITLIATLSASLVVALVIIPTLGRLLDKNPLPLDDEHGEENTHDKVVTGGNFIGFSRHYMRLLEASLLHPKKVVTSAVVILILIFNAYGSSGLGVEFFPEKDNRVIQVIIKDDGSPYSQKEQTAIVDAVYKEAIKLDYIQDVQVLVGGRDQIGALAITLLEWQHRPSSATLMTELRGILEPLAWELDILNASGPQGGKSFKLQISGLPFDELRVVNKQIQQLMSDDGRFTNIEDNGPAGGVEWHLIYDKNLAAQKQVSIKDIGTTVKLLTNGVYVGAYRPDYADEDIDIRLRLSEQYRHLSQLNHLTVNSSSGLVPIAPFISQQVKPRNNLITRVDGEQAITIQADLIEGAQLNGVLNDFEPLLKPFNVAYEFKGEAADQAESGSFLIKAFSVAVFMMAIILVTQFNSYFQVALILSAVVFSSGGVLIGLMVQQMPFSIVMSGIGVIALAGIVVNNNIVLIDTFNGLVADGLSVKDAVMNAVYLRLRPVMLTTITTILGLLPMAMGLNIDLMASVIEVDGPSSAVWGVLAMAIVWFLTFASNITLQITRCLLLLVQRFKAV